MTRNSEIDEKNAPPQARVLRDGHPMDIRNWWSWPYGPRQSVVIVIAAMAMSAMFAIEVACGPWWSSGASSFSFLALMLAMWDRRRQTSRWWLLWLAGVVVWCGFVIQHMIERRDLVRSYCQTRAIDTIDPPPLWLMDSCPDDLVQDLCVTPCPLMSLPE